MNTQFLRLVVCGVLTALVMVASQGCTSTAHRGHDGRPHKIRPHHHKDGLQQTTPVVIVVQKRATPSAAKRRQALTSNLGTQTIDFTAAWPSGLSSGVTVPVKCYKAILDEVSGTFEVYSDSTPLPVFGGSSSTTVTLSSGTPTGSVSINVDNQTGNFFYIGAWKDVASGSNTYSFHGGMILTKP
jgi:hypothetical protein